MAVISLTNGGHTLVDDVDLPLVTTRNWNRHRCEAGKEYASALIREGGRHRRLYLHRVISGAARGAVVDHVNGDTLDNRRRNLRVCTMAQNLANRRKNANNTSGLRGVRVDRTRWRAEIKHRYRTMHLGTFDTAEEAAAAYDAAATRLRGEFARTNAGDAAEGTPMA